MAGLFSSGGTYACIGAAARGYHQLGGYLLILFAPLLIQASAAQWLLLVFAGLTTLLAGLIMMTRTSIKVRLA